MSNVLRGVRAVGRRGWPRGWPLVACAVTALLIHFVSADRQGLWADEIFSLAMATGHSLEHPAAVAEPALGDFVEHARPLPAEEYRRYLRHESPAAGGARVVRALLLSDQSPPLYYILLYGWTGVVGTGDLSLRWFSILWALGCLPLIWSLGHQFGGRRTAWIACLLFVLAPVAIRYSSEARMYSMLWFWSLLTVWASLRLHRRGASMSRLLAWIGSAAAGLLTHYFFLFVLGAAFAWLLLRPGRWSRKWAVASVASVSLLVLPWYLQLPETLGAWRVTQDWIGTRPPLQRLARAPFELIWSFFSADPWQSRASLTKPFVLLCLTISLAVAWRLGPARRSPHTLLLVLWLGGAVLGLQAVDLSMNTYSSSIARYALAGLPAAFILLAMALARSPRVVRLSAVLVLLALWTPGYRSLHADTARGNSPLREVARQLAAESEAGDVIVLHSTPSGVLGIARYFDGPAELTSWVSRLGQRRVPEDIDLLLARYSRVFLVKVHAVGAAAPQEEYLRAHAQLLGEWRMRSAQTLVFAPPRGEGIFPGTDAGIGSGGVLGADRQAHSAAPIAAGASR